MELLTRTLEGASGNAWRLGVFLGLLLVMTGLEAALPRRERREARARRWGLHAGLAATGALVGRLLAPVGAVAAAHLAERQGLGVLPWLGAPAWLQLAAALVLLDLALYAQHVASHRWRWLWRLHRLHHQDVDLDASSGVRFHPGEIAVSTLWKAACVLALGPPVAAVVLFEIALNAASIFNHANLRLGRSFDAALRWFLVTPDMHRVHHSTDSAEQSRNFGFAIPLWDRLFGTYLAAPAAGHEGMELGVAASPPEHREAAARR